ncbi:hypothetical protein B0H10DRAFT_2436184 [Mycena sp. CBHHK59/15]|nr:hypothetical protein B0H10DRAFT_2436184 [Mycena sp. CBHHK59/15]
MRRNRTPNPQSAGRAKHVESMRLLATIYPDLQDSQRQEILQCALMAHSQDPVAVEHHFQVLLATLKSGAVFGAAVPPAGVDIKSFDFDIHKVQNAPFSWNFYIGKRGGGIDSIIQDAHKVYGIKLLDMTGNWATCYPMTVLPGTRVRLLGRGSDVHELVFPLNPYEISAVVHHLPALIFLHACPAVLQNVNGHDAFTSVRYIVQGRCSLSHYPEFRALRRENAKALGDWRSSQIMAGRGASS